MTPMSTSRLWAAGVVLAVVAGATGCVHPPPAPLPDPIITCQSLGGPITYDPPADNTGSDVTITVGPGAALEDCTDNTGNLITGASISGTLLLPDFTCAVAPEGAEIGGGSGSFGWSNGSNSAFSAVLRSPGTANQFVLEVQITSGLWTGATAAVLLGVVSSDGNCVSVPVTEAVLAALEPFVLRPAGST
jgi:hypothetical protein